MLLKVLVVDDEFPAREELVCLLTETKSVEVVGACEDGDEALEFIRERPVDAVFLDVQMPTIDGLSVAREILGLPEAPRVVFTTGFSEHAVKAFDLDAVDYLVKPYSKDRLERAVKKLHAFFPEQGKRTSGGSSETEGASKLSVWSKGRMVLLNYADIFFLRAEGKRNTLVCSKKGNYYTNITLRELEEKLSRASFLRTHKSYLVNTAKIEEVIPWFNNTYQLVLQECPERDIPVARHYVREFNQRMEL